MSRSSAPDSAATSSRTKTTDEKSVLRSSLSSHWRGLASVRRSRNGMESQSRNPLNKQGKRRLRWAPIFLARPVNAAWRAKGLRRFWTSQGDIEVVPPKQVAAVSLAGDASAATITSRPPRSEIIARRRQRPPGPERHGEERHDINISNAAFPFAARRDGWPCASGFRSGARRRPDQDRRHRGSASDRRRLDPAGGPARRRRDQRQGRRRRTQDRNHHL